VKGFLSGARKMVRPHEDRALFVGSSSSGSIQKQLLKYVKPVSKSQWRPMVP
jgi:hypothetical protein